MEMLNELLIRNRSYRSFDGNTTIPEETLRGLISLTRLAPSSVNLQPLKYYPASDAQTVAKILEETHWAGLLPGLRLPPEGHGPAAFIIICQDTAIDPNRSKFQKDVGIAAMTILLAAVEKGYGGCMIGNFQPDTLRKKLELPEQMVPQLVVALGKPDEKILIEDIGPSGSTAYYRDDQGLHHVPKRRIEDLLLR